ncbi:putative SP-containing membrane protein [Vairimorpha necatrix]|uniref:SP-containing membrane protein n=1 Tax=Vairimorpha necatrix TaxID=6039 RepID=A0AAX4JCC1_9MICR
MKQFIIFISLIYNNTNRISNVISKSMYIKNHHKICDTTNGVAEITGQPAIAPKIFIEMIWNIVTDHSAFKYFVSNNITTYPFYNKEIKLKKAYQKLAKHMFSLKSRKFNYHTRFNTNEQTFINDMIGVATGYYKMLGLCYKNVLDKAIFVEVKAKEIMNRNICFIPNRENELPVVVYKLCNGVVKFYVNCRIGTKSKILNLIKQTKEQISTSYCFNNLKKSDISGVKLQNLVNNTRDTNIIDYTTSISNINTNTTIYEGVSFSNVTYPYIIPSVLNNNTIDNAITFQTYFVNDFANNSDVKNIKISEFSINDDYKLNIDKTNSNTKNSIINDRSTSFNKIFSLIPTTIVAIVIIIILVVLYYFLYKKYFVSDNRRYMRRSRRSKDLGVFRIDEIVECTTTL